jgi:hypothetical protein
MPRCVHPGNEAGLGRSGSLGKVVLGIRLTPMRERDTIVNR